MHCNHLEVFQPIEDNNTRAFTSSRMSAVEAFGVDGHAPYTAGSLEAVDLSRPSALTVSNSRVPRDCAVTEAFGSSPSNRFDGLCGVASRRWSYGADSPSKCSLTTHLLVLETSREVWNQICLIKDREGQIELTASIELNDGHVERLSEGRAASSGCAPMTPPRPRQQSQIRRRISSILHYCNV